MGHNPDKFTHDQIEHLITFVKTNKALYVNPREIGKRTVREGLWNELGQRIDKSPELCRKKFKDLRDRFVRNLKKPKPAKFRSHFKNMMFLLEIHPELQSKAERANALSDEEDDDVSLSNDSMKDYDRAKCEMDFVDVPLSTESELNGQDRLSALDALATPATHSLDALAAPATQSLDVLDRFLLGLGATIRTFPEMEIIKLKLELSSIVFNREMELTANRAKAKKCIGDNCKCNCHA